MSIVLCSLVLNEMEWLPKLYEQHRGWPGLLQWIFVESADCIYAHVNPHLVSKEGLSVDGTTQYLKDLAATDSLITYVPYGFSRHKNIAQGKCDSRSQYLIHANPFQPDFLVVLDGDEFYTSDQQKWILDVMEKAFSEGFTGYCFRHRHIWRPASIRNRPLFDLEVYDGFWKIPLCRGWKWFSDLSYRKNHNTPENAAGELLDKRLLHKYAEERCPDCIHLGFASSVNLRKAKHLYYQARGEGMFDHRGWYVQSRAAFETWRPGEKLPHDGKVRRYKGPVPECFQ
jgi:hypothetical protein